MFSTGRVFYWQGLTRLVRQVWTGCLVERAGNLVTVFLLPSPFFWHRWNFITMAKVRLHCHRQAKAGSPLASLLHLVCGPLPFMWIVNTQINAIWRFNYAVLSRIWILTDLRVFCANFWGEKMRLCYFSRFLQVCAEASYLVLFAQGDKWIDQQSNKWMIGDKTKLKSFPSRPLAAQHFVCSTINPISQD